MQVSFFSETTDIKEKETNTIENKSEINTDKVLQKYPNLVKVTTDKGYYYKCVYNNETFLQFIEELILKKELLSERAIKTFIRVNADKYNLDIKSLDKKAIEILERKKQLMNFYSWEG